MTVMATKVPVIITVLVMSVVVTAVTVDSVAIRLGLPDGRGLSGVCLYRNGPDKRQHVMFKAVASARKKPSGGDYMVAGDLAADRVYEGTFARLEDGDQVARFGCNDGRRFEIATPFVVPEQDLSTILAVKESMERRFGPQPSRQDPGRTVTAEHVSVTLRGLRPSVDGGNTAITVDVFQLYKKPNAVGGGPQDKPKISTTAQYSALPYARYSVRYPVDNLMLADLPPDQMLAVKLRSRPVADRGNLTENALFIYTGGLYPRGSANLTKMLDERTGGANVAADPEDGAVDTGDKIDTGDTDTAATSFQIDARLAHRDSYGKPSITIR